MWVGSTLCLAFVFQNETVFLGRLNSRVCLEKVEDIYFIFLKENGDLQSDPEVCSLNSNCLCSNMQCEMYRV